MIICMSVLCSWHLLCGIWCFLTYWKMIIVYYLSIWVSYGYMCVMSHVCQWRRQSCVAKTLMLGITCKLFNQIHVIHAIQTWYDGRYYCTLSTFWYWCNWLWPWFKVTGLQEKKMLCTNNFTKFSIDLNGIWYAVETFVVVVVDEPHTHFVLYI